VGGGFQTGSKRRVGHFWPIVPVLGDCEDGEFGGMKIGRGNRSARRKPCPRAALSITNPNWTDPGSKPGRHFGKPATNRLSYGAAYALDVPYLCMYRPQPNFQTEIIGKNNFLGILFLGKFFEYKPHPHFPPWILDKTCAAYTCVNRILTTQHSNKHTVTPLSSLFVSANYNLGRECRLVYCTGHSTAVCDRSVAWFISPLPQNKPKVLIYHIHTVQFGAAWLSVACRYIQRTSAAKWVKAGWRSGDSNTAIKIRVAIPQILFMCHLKRKRWGTRSIAVSFIKLHRPCKNV
jgi:hypothetical protein